MKALILAFILFTSAISCDNTGADIVPINGTYIGYYHKSGTDTTRVTLHFSDNQFNGSTNKKTYTTLGVGTFRQTSTTLTFTDNSSVTPNSASDPLLEGDFNYTYNDDGTIRIWKKVQGIENEFILKESINDMVVNSWKSPPYTGSSSIE